jgi:hypothetical protein
MPALNDTREPSRPLSCHRDPPSEGGNSRSSARGQSLVEFALVLPMLLVLLLGVADFGRVFAAGITMEAATRNAAEAAAQEYTQIVRTNGSLASADYERLHEIALYALCDEARVLSNRAPLSGAPAGPTANGVVDNPCSMPLAAVCVHNEASATFAPDPFCNGSSDAPSPPAECPTLASGWSTANAQGAGALAYVEVRTCYQFTTLVHLQNLILPFGWSLSLGDIFLQRTRSFTVACYYTGCS